MLLLVKKLQKNILLLWRKLVGCLCHNWKPNFLPLLIFDWHTFSMQVTARRWHQSKKIKCRPIRTREKGGVSLSDVRWWRWVYIYSCLSLQYWNQIFLVFGFVVYYYRTMFYMHHESKKLGIRYYFWFFLLRYYFLFFPSGIELLFIASS